MSIEDYFNRNPVLLNIGEKIVKDVRDKSIEQCRKMLNGNIKSSGQKQLQDKISCLSEEQLKIFTDLVPWIVDDTICQVLGLFADNDDIKLIVDYQGAKLNLVECSDGLDGDFLGNGGWIARFSKIPPYFK